MKGTRKEYFSFHRPEPVSIDPLYSVSVLACVARVKSTLTSQSWPRSDDNIKRGTLSQQHMMAEGQELRPLCFYNISLHGGLITARYMGYLFVTSTHTSDQKHRGTVKCSVLENIKGCIKPQGTSKINDPVQLQGKGKS